MSDPQRFPVLGAGARPVPATSRAGSARAGGLVLAGLTLALAAAGVVVLRSAVREEPAGTAAQPGGATITTDTALEAAAKARQAGDFRAADGILTEAIGHDATDERLHLARAEALLALGDYAGAYRQYQSAIALSGSQGAPALHFQAGTLATKAGLPDRAVEHYAMAMQGDAHNADYPLYLAMVQLKLGRTDEALANLARAARLDPDRAEAWGTAAQVYLARGKDELALQMVRRATALEPALGRWRLVEAKALKRLNEPQEAAALLLGLDEAQRRSPEILGVLGECYGLLGKPGEAALAYAEAFARAPEPEVRAALAYQAALWFHRAGQPEEADRFARSAAGLGHEPARQLLAERGG
ncbi:MAG TPA: tetratricopeptide repeat protein [Phycisphaerales bacterium]|nr:tetratricopeptide repeat protein [Phycisphaerales bacterium]